MWREIGLAEGSRAEFLQAGAMIVSGRATHTSMMLIDDDGSVSDSRSLHLRTRLNAIQVGDGFSEYAVRNLGFVALQPSNRAVHVRLRPTHVSPVAFAGLMYWLADQRPERVMLATLDGDVWQHQMMGNAEMAAARIAQIVRRAQDMVEDLFLAKRRSLDELPEDHPMRQLYEARAELQEAVLRHDIAGAAKLMATHVGGRHSISHATPDLRRIVLAAVGDGFDAEPRYWLQRVVGCRLDDLPDARYGAWAAMSYAEAIREGGTQLHDVDIMIEWPGEGRRRYRSKRLLMPMKDADGRHVVLSSTLTDASIDLRSATGNKAL